MRPLFGRTQYLRSRLLAGRGEAGEVGRFVLLGSGGFDLQRSASGSNASSCITQRRISSALECAYLECDRVRVRVLETEGLRHLLLEGAWGAQYGYKYTEMRAGTAHA